MKEIEKCKLDGKDGRPIQYNIGTERLHQNKHRIYLLLGGRDLPSLHGQRAKVDVEVGVENCGSPDEGASCEEGQEIVEVESPSGIVAHSYANKCCNNC